MCVSKYIYFFLIFGYVHYIHAMEHQSKQTFDYARNIAPISVMLMAGHEYKHTDSASNERQALEITWKQSQRDNTLSLSDFDCKNNDLKTILEKTVESIGSGPLDVSEKTIPLVLDGLWNFYATKLKEELQSDKKRLSSFTYNAKDHPLEQVMKYNVLRTEYDSRQELNDMGRRAINIVYYNEEVKILAAQRKSLKNDAQWYGLFAVCTLFIASIGTGALYKCSALKNYLITGLLFIPSLYGGIQFLLYTYYWKPNNNNVESYKQLVDSASSEYTQDEKLKSALKTISTGLASPNYWFCELGKNEVENWVNKYLHTATKSLNTRESYGSSSTGYYDGSKKYHQQTTFTDYLKERNEEFNELCVIKSSEKEASSIVLNPTAQTITFTTYTP